jgi:tetratricopeptide (TPR) repeat protein
MLVLGTLRAPAARAGEAAPDLDPDTEVARRHFRAGSAAYAQGDYGVALDQFVQARRAKPLPDLDYNIGRCHDRLEHYAEAIAAYQRFVDGSSDPQERARTTARIDVLRARLRPVTGGQPERVAAPGPATTPVSAVVPPSPSDAAHAYRGPAIVGAVGLAALAVGLGLYGSVGHDYDLLEQGCAPACAPSRWEGLRARERAGLGLVIAGGVVAIADIAYFAVVGRSRRHRSSAPPVAAAGVTVGMRR